MAQKNEELMDIIYSLKLQQQKMEQDIKNLRNAKNLNEINTVKLFY